ncbi:MAG: flagellar hook protein FlgE [Alphaproteobacteria bacterium]|nr:flagellar hook protein FlgE [Alphaproteobacteria bacterium]MCL2505210.1 flagellar hook protein FlgE [Alphaproteobacteria bacterium]
MSLFSALGVAVTGLNAQSQSIGNISDNLANAQTTGFKTISTYFSDIVTVSNAVRNNPGGVRAAPHYHNALQGTIASTDTITNLAISGDGYFCVTSARVDTAGKILFDGAAYYTRAGDFIIDKDGFMVNSSGYYLLGYKITDGITNTASTEPIQISALLDNPEATVNVNYVANLPAGQTADYQSTPSTVTIYDALGATHQVSIVWAPDNDGATPPNVIINTWVATVTVQDGLGLGTDFTTNFTVKFHEGPSVTGGPAGTIESITGPGAATGGIGDPAFVTLPGLTFPGAGSQDISLNLGHFGVATGLTQFANASETVSVTSISQDGLGEGSYSGIEIDSLGIISIHYTNGSVRKIYQIPVATFNSPDNLQRHSGGIYTATINSGSANLRTPGSNGSGLVISSSLEASTVDIATEFTKMIMAQQVYSANAKVVTVTNDMLGTIMQAVR